MRRHRRRIAAMVRVRRCALHAVRPALDLDRAPVPLPPIANLTAEIGTSGWINWQYR
jgi:hypothetical protein